jgi:hypothetical protein
VRGIDLGLARRLGGLGLRLGVGDVIVVVDDEVSRGRAAQDEYGRSGDQELLHFACAVSGLAELLADLLNRV